MRQVDLGPAPPIDEAVGLAGGHRAAANLPGRRGLRRTVWEPLARHFPRRHDHRAHRARWPLTAVPWGALARRPAGHGLAGAILPGHRPPRAVRPRPADGARASPDGGGPCWPSAVWITTAPKPLGEAAGTDLCRPGGNGPSRGPRATAMAGAACRARPARSDGGEAGRTRAAPARGDRGQHRAAAPRVAQGPMGPHRHPRLLRQPQGSLHPPTRSQVVCPRRPPECAGLRSPLVLSGLVLAGANRPSAAVVQADRSGDDQGIVTAEAIAGLPLPGLELVVLSACETGLGLVGGGEGVFGLQRLPPGRRP